MITATTTGTITGTAITTTMDTDRPQAERAADGLLKLAAWTSPSFPVGAFAYSHGLEWAVEAGLVRDAETLRAWAAHLLAQGAPRQDAVLLARSYRRLDDEAALLETAELAAALKGTAELAQETVVQGGAFLRTVRAAWPQPALDALATRFARDKLELALPVAVGLCAAAHGIDLSATLRFFLHGAAANTVSAAIRLSMIGQTDGQRVTAALEPVILSTASLAEAAEPDALWSAVPMVDWCSMRHETQHTRLFRS
ncbi:urease accessory protein UreF [Thalassobaculum litoreum]|nr:urease accessory protein UreF [Thalassobaculum litoreum]